MAISYLIGPAVVENTVAHNTTPLINNTNFNATVAFNRMYYVVLRAQIMSLMRIGMFFKEAVYKQSNFLFISNLYFSKQC